MSYHACDNEPTHAWLGCFTQCNDCYCYEHGINHCEPHYPVPAPVILSDIDPEYYYLLALREQLTMEVKQYKTSH